MPETVAESIAAVQAEMAAEAAAKPAEEAKTEGKPIPAEALEKLDAPVEDAEGKAEAKADAVDGERPDKKANGEGKKPGETETDYKARLNETNAKLRKAEKRARDLEAELERVKGPKGEPTAEEKIRADEREKVRAEEKRLRYLEQGQEVYGVEVFQEAETKLIQMGFNRELLDLAQEGLNDRQAAKALYRLAFEPEEAIQEFLGKKRAGQAIALADLARRRDRGDKDDEPEAKAEEARPVAKPAVRVSQAPAPIVPMAPGAAGTVLDDIFAAGLSDAEFNDRLDKRTKSMNPRAAALLGR